MPVSLERSGAVALITVDNPPVNATSHAVRAGLVDAVARLGAADDLGAAVLLCAGRTFIAGADMREFGQPPRDPLLPEVVDAIERCTKPIVAAIHGTALGGGMEIALGCHARIASSDAKLGFPEVHVGVIPGGGGTQRLPRLIGIENAVDLITSGRRIDAARARALGLIDAVAEDDLLAEAIALADTLARSGTPPTRLSDRPVDDGGVDWDALAAQVRKTAKGLAAPLRALEAIRGATLPFADGLARERAIFRECRDSEEGRALRHAFFAERRAAGHQGDSQPIARVGIVGAGTMGRGIALAFAAAGIPVVLVDRDDAALDPARRAIDGMVDGDCAKGRISADEAEARKAAITLATEIAAMADCDLAIEAVFEDPRVKQGVFAALGQAMKPEAVLATNTSYLDVAALAAVSGRPTRVIGLHFFSPAHLMKLVEVIATDRSDPQVVATGFAAAKALGKIPARAANAHGFIGNRIWSAYRRQADYLVEDGATPAQVDGAMVDFGFRMGPFAALDLAGLDVGLAVRQQWHRDNPTRRYVDLSDRLCAMGRTGQKAGAGWYRYQAGDRTPLPDPEVDRLIAAAARERGIAPRSVSDEEIRSRILLAMVNEACHVLAEGVAQRPSDIDVVLLNGYGFPRARGGPMFWADRHGLDVLADQLDAFAERDPTGWEPCALLRDLAASGRRFADLNAA